MKEKLYIYDIGETKRTTNFKNFNGIGTTGQFIIQNYFKDKIEKSGCKFYPMFTVDCGDGVFEDVYSKYFNRPEINLDDYDLVYSLPDQFKYKKWHYDWYDDEKLSLLKTNYMFNESFSKQCEKIYDDLDRPEIAYQIRETDKFDENDPDGSRGHNCPLPTLFYEEHMRKYKDKIIASGAINPGTPDYKRAQNLLKAYTNEGTGDTFGETDAKSEQWLTLYGNLEEIFNTTYKNTYMRNGQIVSTPEDAFKQAQAAVKEVVNDNRAVQRLMVPDLDPSDDSYSRRIQLNLQQSSGGKWKKRKLSIDLKTQEELIAWGQSPLKQSIDVPVYYRDLAMRMGVNPIDLANQQLKFYTEDEVKEDKKEQKYDDKVLELIYKYPTRSRITRARLETEGAGDANAKTSIYNKKALMRKDM